MGTIVKKSVIQRKPGYLYYVDGKGNVCEAKTARKKSAKKAAPRKKAAAKKKATKRK